MKITQDQFDSLAVALDQLNTFMQSMGIAELKFSRKEKIIYWDTANGGQVEPALIDEFCNAAQHLTEQMEKL